MAADQKAYMREYRKRMRQTPEGREKLRVAKKKWKQSENGKKAARAWAKKKYVPHPLPRVERTDDERRASERAYYKKTQERRRELYRKGMSHLRRYGLSKAEYFAMVEAQSNCCAICGESPNPSAKKRLLCVDHCHDTGRIRGLLCDSCNKGIGNLKENAAVLFRAILYLRRA